MFKFIIFSTLQFVLFAHADFFDCMKYCNQQYMESQLYGRCLMGCKKESGSLQKTSVQNSVSKKSDTSLCIELLHAYGVQIVELEKKPAYTMKNSSGQMAFISPIATTIIHPDGICENSKTETTFKSINQNIKQSLDLLEENNSNNTLLSLIKLHCGASEYFKDLVPSSGFQKEKFKKEKNNEKSGSI